MLTKIAVVTVVALVLGFILAWRGPLITPVTYKLAFCLGLAALGVYFYPRRGAGIEYIEMDLGRGEWAYFASRLFGFLILSPFVVLIETGIAGYRGFLSPGRYVCLALVILGGAGVAASFLVPRLLRH
jgi:hypothetical protein